MSNKLGFVEESKTALTANAALRLYHPMRVTFLNQSVFKCSLQMSSSRHSYGSK